MTLRLVEACRDCGDEAICFVEDHDDRPRFCSACFDRITRKLALAKQMFENGTPEHAILRWLERAS